MDSACDVAYDEVVDAAGRRRPAYSALAERLGWDPLVPQEEVTRGVGDRPLGDATRIIPSPLILDNPAYSREIQAGVAQRARALQQYFADVVLGDAAFLCGYTELTASLLDEILTSEGTSLEEVRRGWKGQALDAIRFVYGPDLVREPGGRWVVLEDNAGCVSGCADSFLALAAYTRAIGLRANTSHRPDLVVAVEHWLESLGLRPTDAGVIAFLTDGDHARWYGSNRFDEDLRRQRLVQELGPRVVDNAGFEQAWRELGPDELEAVVNIGAPSNATWAIWLEAFFGRSRVPFLNAPGTSVLGNKALLPFVSDMVAFYLGEEPILDTPGTTLLLDGVLPSNPELWVVKMAAGCDGAGVYILGSETPERLEQIGGAIESSWPARAAVAQRRVTASRFAGYSVEIRALSYVLGWQSVFTGEQCVARLTPENGGRREQILAPVLSGFEADDKGLAFAAGSWGRAPIALRDPEPEGTAA